MIENEVYYRSGQLKSLCSSMVVLKKETFESKGIAQDMKYTRLGFIESYPWAASPTDSTQTVLYTFVEII